jgi:hypothetical protein
MTRVTDMIDVARDEWLPRSQFETENLPRITRTPESREAIEAHHGGGALNGRDPVATWRAYWRYHVVTLGWQDLWYNVGIHPDGRLFELRGAYAANSSRPWLTVNFPGNSDHDLTDAQLDTFQALRYAHWQDTGHDMLRWHAQRGGTQCPGATLIQRLKDIQTAEAEAGGIMVASTIPFNDPNLPDAIGPLVGPITVPGFDGYFVVGADGGVFAFGELEDFFHGSLPGKVPNHDWTQDPIVGFAPYIDSDGQFVGYYLMSRLGAMFAFGAAPWHGRVERIV